MLHKYARVFHVQYELFLSIVMEFEFSRRIF